MLKIVTLIVRKKGMSKESFRDHYETVHVPLIHSLFPEIAKSVRNYPASDNFHYVGSQNCPLVPYDVVTELFVADRPTYQRMMENFSNDPEKFRRLSEDEENFCDKASMVMFLVDCESSTGA